MNREVTLTISGLHMGDGAGADSVSIVAAAEYFQRNNSHYLLYEENMEGFTQPLKNRIKFRNNMLELTRRGPVDTHMIFEEKKKHVTNYSMPYGEILLGIDTGRVLVEEGKDSIKVTVEYALEMNGEHQADSRIEIAVDFHK